MSESLATFTLEKAHFLQFSANVEQALQREGNKLRPSVEVNTRQGKSAQVVNFIRSTSFTVRNTIAQPTQITQTQVSQRWVKPTTYNTTQLVDDLDTMRMLWNPTSGITQSIVKALQREEDNIIMNSFYADAMVGQNGLETVSFPSSNVIAFDGGSGLVGTDQKMTVNKLKRAKTQMQMLNVDVDDSNLYMAITAEQEADLMGEVAVTSNNYNNGKPLVDGKMSYFYGINLIKINNIIPSRTATTEIVSGTTNSTGTVLQCPMWTADAIDYSIWEAPKLRVDPRPDLSYAQQIFCEFTAGATRKYEEKVMAVEAAIS